MVTITGTVKSAGFDTSGLCLLCQTGADNLRSSDVAARLAISSELGADFGFERGSRNEHAVALGSDDGGVNVQVGAVHRQTIDLLQLDAGASGTGAAQTVFLLVDHSLTSPLYFFLVSLMTTCSSA